MTLSKMITYIAVLVAALLLGKWYDTERKALLVKGAPLKKQLTTVPAILIGIILILMLFLRFYLDKS
ncbi:MAG: hypothetical protein CSA22_00785 [Deltaproteobacteria bacterium]|nr:MAG: hypothetical protein CSA22_00785 [Deltaproteobacteria bacterium]